MDALEGSFRVYIMSEEIFIYARVQNIHCNVKKQYKVASVKLMPALNQT